MKRPLYWFIALILFSLAVTISALAQTPQRNAATEQKIVDDLKKIAPRSVENFNSATKALDSKDYPEAARLYIEVLKQASNFTPALRRLAFSLAGQGRHDDALLAVRKAVEIDRSAANLASLAQVLAVGTPNNQPSDGDFEEAFNLSKEAWQKNSDQTDSSYAAMYAQTALLANRDQDFRAAVTALNDKFPNDVSTHYYNAVFAAGSGNYVNAEDELQKSVKLGLNPEAAQELRDGMKRTKNNESSQNRESSGEDSSWGIYSYLRVGMYIVIGWLLGLLALFFVGEALSASTLRKVERSDPNDITGGGQATLRRIYRTIIFIAGIYYYLSQPILILFVLVAMAGIAAFFIWVGTIPLKLLFIVGFVGLGTIIYMIKALFAPRTKAVEPGRAVTEAEAPGLWKLVRDVADTVGTRPVNEIRITLDTELAVYERGGIRAKMQDKADRILILGVAVLNDFHQNAFRTVLAHEYGHFSHRDTAGGDIAMSVNNDIMRLADAMARSGTATVYNIVFQFLRFYHYIFRRITHGASRLQELMADRVAAYQYGADAFREGLSHVIRRSIEFDYMANNEINTAYGKRTLQNLYEMTIDDERVREGLAEEFEKSISRETTEDDTQPAPRDRFRLVEKVQSRGLPPIEGLVWDLFANKHAIKAEMTAVLQQYIKAPDIASDHENLHRKPEREERILAELQKISPQLPPRFSAATLALDEDKPEQAMKLYQEVLVDAPDFTPAIRRLGAALLASGKRGEAIETIQRAVALDRNPDNLISLVYALIDPGPENVELTPEEFELAYEMAVEAMQKNTEYDGDYPAMVMRTARLTNREEEYYAAADILLNQYPDYCATHYLKAVSFLVDRNPAQAEIEINKAEKTGLAKSWIDALRRDLDKLKNES